MDCVLSADDVEDVPEVEDALEAEDVLDEAELDELPFSISCNAVAAVCAVVILPDCTDCSRLAKSLRKESP